MKLNRRSFVSGVVASTVALPETAWGNVLTSPRPLLRPGPKPKLTITEATQALLNDYNLSGQIGFSLLDARSGKVLVEVNPETALPPASTAKAITAAYAFDTLGPGHHFTTQVLASGPIRNGKLTGDLILVGSGAPGLSSGQLARLTRELKDQGLHEVTGRFLVWANALPQITNIDPNQPLHLGYSPSVSGLNLNYNRVHFDWKRKGADFVVTMDARDGSILPPVSHATMRIADRAVPIFTHSTHSETAREHWTVARQALGNGGARWLPVRDGARYTADVFRTLARSEGLVLPEAEFVPEIPRGVALATVVSPALSEIARGMLRYSTNLTAEVLGLASSVKRLGGLPESLDQSAKVMSDWAAFDLGASSSRFVDHSGLGDASRVTSRDMTNGLIKLGPDGALRRVLREIGLKTDSGSPEPLRLWAKTGTLNFVSALTGHIATSDGPALAFTILTADLERRAAIPKGDEENPPGSRSWTRRSREMQYDLVRLWADLA